MSANAMTTEKIIITVGDVSSSLQHFTWPDYLVFVVMLIVCTFIGIYFGLMENRRIKRKKINRNVEQEQQGSVALNYLVGGRKMQVFPVAMSLIATFISGISMLGTPTEIYVYGTQYGFILISIILSGVIVSIVFLPVFVGLKLTTAYEYLELRFDRNVRLFGSILFTIGTVFWLPIVIYVPALAFNQVTGVSIYAISTIVCIVCIFYTCVGGLKAVIWTDVMQTFIIFGTMFLVIVKGTNDIGGFGVVWTRNYESGRIIPPELTLDPIARYSYGSIFIGGLVYWLPTGFLDQVMMQRYLSLPSVQAARRTLIIFKIGLVMILGCFIYTGLLIYATYHNCDPLSTQLAQTHDQLLPLLVMDILGVYPGLPGLFIAGIFSAALSSLSTGLNSLAAITLQDFCRPNMKRPITDHEAGIILKGAVLLFGGICLCLVYVVEQMGTVLQLSMTLNALMCGPMFGIFLIGVCIPWFNAKSTLTGAIVALCMMSWIVIKNQYDIMTGRLQYPIKPVTTDGCTYSFPNITDSEDWMEYTKNYNRDIFHMSFLWYTILGSIMTVLIAGLATTKFGKLKPRELNPDLISPIIRKWVIPREYLRSQSDYKEGVNVIHEFEFKSNQ